MTEPDLNDLLGRPSSGQLPSGQLPSGQLPGGQAPSGELAGGELETLLDRLCLGELDADGWRRVGELVRGDREATARYVEASHFCETLREATAQGDPGPYAPSDDSSNPGVVTREVHQVVFLEGLSTVESRVSGGWGPIGWLAPWGVAVSVAFLCGWGASRGIIAPEGTASPAAVAASPAPQPFVLAEDRGRSEPLGRVTGLTPVASSDGLMRSLKAGSQLGRGEVFQLTRGAARLEIAAAEVLVQGPAELSVIDTATLFVRSGRVSVKPVGKLSVQTPVAIASGQAAHFTVSADAEAGVEIAALEGRVAVESAPRRGRSREKVATLRSGQAVAIADSGSGPLRAEIVESAGAAKGRRADWGRALEELHPYEKLVLADKPLAYWPLYRVRRHRAVLDLTQNGFDGYAIGNWPTELSDVHATQTRGAYFDGGSYIESDRKPPVNLRTGFTIESWARLAGGPGYQSVFTSRWVLESNTPREQCFGFTLYAGENDRWQLWTGSGEYGRNWDQLHADREVQRNRWTHVAAMFEPDADQQNATQSVAGAVRIYIDGEQVGESRHTVSLEDFAWPARIGAAEFVPRSLTSWLFVGELRDVALYDQVLGPERVRAHAELGKKAI